MEQRYFEDVDPGDEFAESWIATREQVAAYLDLGNRALRGQGRFTDHATARELGLERPIVPGTMSVSVLTRLVTDWMAPYGTLRSIDVNFRRPVHQGEQLRVLALVVDAHEDGGRPTVKLDVYLENERGDRPLQGVAVVELPRRPA